MSFLKRNITFSFLVWLLAEWLEVGACLRAQDLEVILSIDVPGFSQAEGQSIYRSLGLSVGGKYQSKLVSEAAQALVAKGSFFKVLIFGTASQQGLRVEVVAERTRKIVSVDLSQLHREVAAGVEAYFGFEKKATGVVLPQKSISLLRDRIRLGYELLGYYSSDINFDFEETPEGTQLKVSVKENEPTIVESVKVIGGTTEENKVFLSLVSLSPRGKFSQKLIEESSRKINFYLQKNQFTTSKVEDVDFSFEEGKRTVSVIFRVRLLEKFQFLFSGNEVLSEVELRSMMTEDLLSQGGANEKLVNAIEERYRSLGYHFCQVKFSVLTLENKQTLSRFSIEEGPKVKIDRLHIRGNTSEETKEAAEDLFFSYAPGVLSRKIYWEKGLDEAVSNLKKNLVELGYLAASIGSPRTVFTEDNKGAELFVEMEFGNRTRVQRVEFLGLNHFSESDAKQMLGVEEGESFEKSKWIKSRERFLEEYRSQGFINARYSEKNEKSNGINVSRDSKQVTLEVELDEGTRFYVGKIEFEGNRRTKQEVLARELKIESGGVYSPQAVRQSEENIQTLGLYSRVEIIASEDPSNPNRKNLKVLVKENAPGVGEVGLGGFYEDPRLRLRTFLGATYRNLLGLNQTLSARSEIVLPLSSRGSLIPFVEYAGVIAYRCPYPFEIPLTFMGQLLFDSFEVSTDTSKVTIQSRTRVEGRIEKKFSRHFTGIYRLFQLERTNTELLDKSQPDTIDIIGSTGPGMILDFRDDPYNPVKGSYHTLNIELASPLLLSQDNISFYMAITRNTVFVPIFSWLRLSLFGGGGYAQSLFEGRGIPVARLANDLSLGGQGSIRGFSVRRFSSVPSISDPLQAIEKTAYYNGRAELASPLFQNLSTALFFDTGEVFPRMVGSGRHDGVGVGLRYKTPVGPFAVDLAQGLGKDREQIKFYFTFGTL